MAAHPMFRALVYGLTILHLGPGLAFALLAFGCGEPDPFLRSVCGRSGLASFVWLTLGTWVLLLVGLVATRLVQRARQTPPPNAGPRALALVAVLSTGALAGAAVSGLTGSQQGFLAIPGALAVAWLFLANPLACTSDPPVGTGPAGPGSAD